MNKKIYWCEENGTVYWLDGGKMMFAPMSNDSTADLDESGEVESWDDCPVAEDEVRAKLA